MLIGLARTSTFEQEAGLEAQKRALLAAGVERLFEEQTSAIGPRPGLEKAFEWSREGDTLVVTDLSVCPERKRFSAGVCAVSPAGYEGWYVDGREPSPL